MAQPDPIEDCDTWQLLMGTCAHNRCFSFGVDQHGQLGQGVSARLSRGDDKKPPVKCSGPQPPRPPRRRDAHMAGRADEGGARRKEGRERDGYEGRSSCRMRC